MMGYRQFEYLDDDLGPGDRLLVSGEWVLDRQSCSRSYPELESGYGTCHGFSEVVGSWRRLVLCQEFW